MEVPSKVDLRSSSSNRRPFRCIPKCRETHVAFPARHIRGICGNINLATCRYPSPQAYARCELAPSQPRRAVGSQQVGNQFVQAGIGAETIRRKRYSGIIRQIHFASKSRLYTCSTIRQRKTSASKQFPTSICGSKKRGGRIVSCVPAQASGGGCPVRAAGNLKCCRLRSM